jgi:hypothetical protein
VNALSNQIILLSFKRKSAKAYWYLLLFYVFAKLFEYFDGQIFELFGLRQTVFLQKNNDTTFKEKLSA